jgi:hypothetical protein
MHYALSPTNTARYNTWAERPQSTATHGFHTSACVGSIYGRKVVGLYGRDVDGEAFEGDVPTADLNKIGTRSANCSTLSLLKGQGTYDRRNTGPRTSASTYKLLRRPIEGSECGRHAPPPTGRRAEGDPVRRPDRTNQR